MSISRMRDVFLQLLRADSPFSHEKPTADIVTAFLDEHNVHWREDQTARQTGCDTGNIIVAGAGKARLCFCAHMDTIRIYDRPSIIEGEGVIRAQGGGVMGADDKSGVAVLLESIVRMREQGDLPQDIHFLFTVSEEEGFLGAKYVDERHFKDAYAFVVDSAGAPIGHVVTKGVGQYRFEMTVTGRMSHTSSRGKGVSAILCAAEMLCKLPASHQPGEVFVNIAHIHSHGNPNTVPEKVFVSGQVLYYDQRAAKRIMDEMENVAMGCAKRRGAVLEFRSELQCEPFTVQDTDGIVRYARTAAREAGLDFHTGQTGAGSDAHMFAQRGGNAIKIATGMKNVHSRDEHISLRDMEECVRYILALAGFEKKK